ncbi:MAG: hypothetical protein KatS3mg017_0491 [Fimbriimonadales bacterium]|nr:MAG: hypothetical protein KatS3mg017_0491 [Fimbriimonadales bacterium]GIV07980.1 MAG: hypothetical protein KatS3mg019_0071 [Fimbriimonadales bacterium]
MTHWLRSEAWRLRWLPLLTATAGVAAVYMLQEVPLLRRHALLLALLAGLGFFLPAVRHRLLILFAYGLGLYFITKSVASWLSLPVGGLGAVEQVLWLPLGLMCVASALGMGRRRPPEWPVALLMVALGLYFANYTYAEYTRNNWLQVLAGVGLMGAAVWHAAVVWAEGQNTPEGRA